MIILVDKPQAVAGMRAGALSELTGTAVPCGAQSLLRTAWEQTWSDKQGTKTEGGWRIWGRTGKPHKQDSLSDWFLQLFVFQEGKIMDVRCLVTPRDPGWSSRWQSHLYSCAGSCGVTHGLLIHAFFTTPISKPAQMISAGLWEHGTLNPWGARSWLARWCVHCSVSTGCRCSNLLCFLKMWNANQCQGVEILARFL